MVLLPGRQDIRCSRRRRTGRATGGGRERVATLAAALPGRSLPVLFVLDRLGRGAASDRATGNVNGQEEEEKGTVHCSLEEPHIDQLHD